MQKLIMLALTICFIAGGYAQSEKITGIWVTEDGKSQIKIEQKNNGTYYGKLIRIKDTEEAMKYDKNNPDPELRDRKLIGINILKNLEYNKEADQWEDGVAYDPQNGKSYSCYCWFEDQNYNILHLKGYVLGMRFLGRETEWKRK